jgi:hypothetical protein
MHNYSHQEFQLIKKTIANLSNSNPNWKAMGWRYKTTNGERTGDVAIILIVEKKLPLNDIQDKDVFPQSITIPGLSESVKTDVQIGPTIASIHTHDEDELTDQRTGIYAVGHCHHEPWKGGAKVREDSWTLPVSSHRGIHRPLLGGISIGSFPMVGYDFDDPYMTEVPFFKTNLTGTGTLGGLCIDRDDNTVVGISNNHVIGGHMLIGSYDPNQLVGDLPHAAYQSMWNILAEQAGPIFFGAQVYPQHPHPVVGLTYYSFLCANDTTRAPNEIRYPVYQRSYGDHWRGRPEHEQLHLTPGSTAGPFNGSKQHVDQLKVGTVKRVYPLSATNNKIDVAIFALEQFGNSKNGGPPITTVENITPHNYRPYISGANTRMTSVATSDWSKGASNTTLTDVTLTDDERRARPWSENVTDDEAASGSSQVIKWSTALNVKSGGTSNQYVELAVSDFEGGELKAGQAYRVSFWYKWISKSENGQVQLGGTDGPEFPSTSVAENYGNGGNRLFTYDDDANFVQKEGYSHPAYAGRVGMINSETYPYVYEATIVTTNSTDGLRIYLNTDSGSTDDEIQISNVHMIENNSSTSITNTLFDKTKSWKQLNLGRQDEDMADSVQGLSAMGFATTAEIDSLGDGGANEGAPVFKSGRTTGPVGYPGSAQYTTGVCQLSVYDVAAAVNVSYGGNLTGWPLGYVEQLAIRGKDDNPAGSVGGDSGAFWYALFHEGTPSLSAWKVIGLNFAGTTTYDGTTWRNHPRQTGRIAIANRIDNVASMFRLSAYRGQDLDIGYKNVDIKVVNSRSDAVTALIGGNMYWQAGSTNDMGPPGYPGAGAALPSHR